MWDNMPPRIKFETIIAKTVQGGLKITRHNNIS